MADRESILIKVRWMVERLSQPLSAPDVQCGWIDKSRLAFLSYFQELEQKLVSGEPIPAINIPRGMDSWGILGGDMFQISAEISIELPKLA